MKDNTVPNIHSALIDILTEQRKKLELSHERLAALAGVHRTAISHIENRRRQPTLIICLKLANAMRLSFADLLKEAEERAKLSG
jgi:DNA-binding XRE family transcriptional regulator